MRNQYIYNKNNKFYNSAEKIFEDENSIAYKPNKNEKIDDMDSEYIELSYDDIRKPDTTYIANKVINKLNDLGGLFNLLDNDFSKNFTTTEEQLMITDFIFKYIKQDIKKVMKSAKNNFKNIKVKNKKSATIKLNVVNILCRFQEDLFFGRISI